MKKKKTVNEIRELHRFAWETPMTQRNADDILAARKALAEIEADDKAEHQLRSKNVHHGARMRGKSRSLLEKATDFLYGFIPKDASRKLQSDYDYVAEGMSAAQITHINRREGRAKKRQINVRRQAEFSLKSVNSAERIAGKVMRQISQTEKEAHKLSTRAKRFG